MASGVMPSPALQVSVDVTEWPEHLRQQLLRVAGELAAEASKPLPMEPESTGWTRELLDAALATLAASGAQAQVECIWRAVSNGGTIPRSEVYEVAGYPEGRSLRGFTRPTNRVVQSMRDKGLLPDEAEELLTPHYSPHRKGYRPAEAFTVPPEAVILLRA
jgi:hypothetical protein